MRQTRRAAQAARDNLRAQGMASNHESDDDGEFVVQENQLVQDEEMSDEEDYMSDEEEEAEDDEDEDDDDEDDDFAMNVMGALALELQVRMWWVRDGRL